MKRDYFYWFRKTFHVTEESLNPKIKLELKGIFVSFFPPVIFLQPSTKKTTS